MYEYLIGTIGLGAIFSSLYFIRKDLRRLMLYGGSLYLLFMTAVFLLSKVLSSDPAKAINPGYWAPPTILNLNNRTGGLGIEDVFYMFFVGAIAAGLYETIFSFKVTKKPDKKLKKGHALLFGLGVGSLLFIFLPVNAVYMFIFLQFTGFLAIIWQRRDLIYHALGGGLFFMFLYGILFLVFNLLFPSFLGNYYHLQKTSHVWILGVPLEEFLYSFTLGLMWAPIYEYEKRVKDRKSKRLNLAPQKFFAAAAGSKR